METIDILDAADALCENLTEEEEDELAREFVDRVADKWSLWVMHVLAQNGRLRFSRVLEKVEGVSQKMLTKTLRQLERDGLITRTMYMEVPPRVEYELTPIGLELLQQVTPLWMWILEHLPTFKAARTKFDDKAKRNA